MLWIIFVVLIVMWMLGMASTLTLAGIIQISVILAIASVVIGVVEGRKRRGRV